ncbi:hypothetical protein FOA52_009023 [Chlamydomonas sp. UWO 241]|nr:hypothetical protein FOA52_009023 [Chlamydomonas sp. UWO 241]
MVQALKDADCKLLSSQEVVSVQAQGGMVVDIRPAGDYEKSHIPGAVSVPFYRPIAGWSPMQAMRRVAFAAFGILNGTEVNPDFEKEVDAAAADAKSVILYCNQGGNFNVMEMGKASFMPDKPDGESRGGKTVLQTRSVIAAYRLLVCGRTSGLSVYKGGFREWVSSGERPVEQ